MDGLSTMSPEAMLEYCQTKLSNLDDDMNQAIKQQQLQQQEYTAVKNAQDALENFGTDGPQNGKDFQTCVDAIDKAAASLPPNDPVAQELEAFKTSISKQYGYHPEKLVGLSADPSLPEPLTPLIDLSLLNKPQNSDWQGTTDALQTMADSTKSDAEIQMLQLQDLVSQRQQAVQLASGIMSKEDETLEGITKSIGGRRSGEPMDITEFRASTRPAGPVSRQTAIEAIYATGHWLLEQQRTAEAAAVFRTMIHAEPRDERGWLGLGECHERAEQPRIAAEILGAGSAVAPSPVRLLLARARALVATGLELEAEQSLGAAHDAADSSDDPELKDLVARERRRRP